MSWRWEVEPQNPLAGVLLPMMLPLFARSMQHDLDALAKGGGTTPQEEDRQRRSVAARASLLGGVVVVVGAILVLYLLRRRRSSATQFGASRK